MRVQLTLASAATAEGPVPTVVCRDRFILSDAKTAGCSRATTPLPLRFRRQTVRHALSIAQTLDKLLCHLPTHPTHRILGIFVHIFFTLPR